MTVFLVGSMGVGKSAMGRRLAEALNIAFCDTDDLIVAAQSQTINDIFNQYGEPYFRALETKLLAEFDYTKSQLIATGGGLPMTEGNIALMKKNGVVVFLKDDIDPIVFRLYKGRYKRPAIKDLNITQIKDKLKIMLDTRTPTYEKAHLTFLRSKDLDKDVLQLSTYLQMYL